MRLTNDQYKQLLNKSITSKYKNKKVVVNGIKFDSQKEARYYTSLLLLERTGRIKDLRRQVKYELQPSFKLNSKTIRAINYIADFVYYDTKNECIKVIDVKGSKETLTDVYKLKKKLFEYKYQIEIEEVY